MADDQTTYGYKLRKLRLDAGLTQEVAALRIGVSKTSLRNWEKARAIPTVENLNRLRYVYEIPESELPTLDSIYFMSRKALVKTLSEVIDAD